ncbi:MAG: hypothetical protein MUQ65_05410 [Armatimonadetes bacterium]|jgi:hypothetical protein|nr:hypothetical protein [Armatimonadota bacterium]
MFSKGCLLVLLCVLATMLATGSPASAAQYTDVAGIQPFAAESNFMSLAGYLRWTTFKEQGVWLSMPEAKRIVAQQTMAREK